MTAIKLEHNGQRIVIAQKTTAVLDDDGTNLEDPILKCPVVELLDDMIAISSKQVIGSAALFHACNEDYCDVVEGTQDKTIERTNVTLEKPVLKCNTEEYPYYIYNRFCYRH